ncbi:MAG: V-type ATP synthase subunit E [Parachlamydia sp.]|nr:V-type ATP synthase subunit E [Parachlamydia sp.]
MKTLEQGKQKIQKICEVIKEETLEPARKEAETIVSQAEERARAIIADAEKQAERTQGEVRQTLEQERHIFQSSLQQASKQTITMLKQEIENKLFNSSIKDVVEKHPEESKLAAKLTEAIVKAIDRDGVSADFSVAVSQALSAKEVNALLSEQILAKLKEKSVVLGNFASGVQVKLHDKKMTLDLSDKVLTELLANYVRKDFRKWIFAQE